MEKWKQLLVVMLTCLLMVAFAAVCIGIAGRLHHTLLMFSLALLVAYALDPVVEFLRRFRLFGSKRESTREVAITTLFLSLIVIFGLAIWGIENRAVHEAAVLQQNLPEYRLRAEKLAEQIDARAAERGMKVNAVETLRHPPKDVTNAGMSLAKEGLPILGHILAGAAESVIVLLIAVYLLIFGHDMRRQFNRLFPEDLGHRIDLWETDVNRILGSFVRGQLIIAIIVGVAAAIGCLAIGIHAWLLIGLFVIAATLIPVFGPYIGAVPAIIAAAVGPTHFSPVVAVILVVVYFVIVNEVGSKVLYPKLVGDALGLHPVFVLFVLFAGLEIAGVIGVLFAAPVAALVIATAVHLFRYWQNLPDDLLSHKPDPESPAIGE
jgi:predicted PurR-regulated permease PerM